MNKIDASFQVIIINKIISECIEKKFKENSVCGSKTVIGDSQIWTTYFWVEFRGLGLVRWANT